MNIEFVDLINKIKDYNPDEVGVVTKAYEVAKELHKGQYRESGDEYMTHPLTVAFILAEMHADRDTVCAGLLHDTLEDTNFTKEDIANIFNPNIANLVDGVTKLAKMNFSSKESQNRANTRKIITGLTTDVRIISIKLADRLHNMRTLQYKTVYKQRENAMETMDIFVPLAYYIGAYKIKSELEDLSLKYLYPDIYRRIEEKKTKIEIDSSDCLIEMYNTIKKLLKNKDIPNKIKIRTKNIYGIYKRLKEENKLSDIHDLLALKVMVDNIDNCYKTLGVVHSVYHPLNDTFKDYICKPKTNMYKSLHTTVFAPDDRLVQTQIRTFEMDNIADFGLTAYWDMNKSEARNTMQKDLKEKYQFFNSLVEIDKMFRNNKDFVDKIKSELFADKIYVYTTKGEIIELPSESTAIDFAYEIGDDVGNTMVGAEINGKIAMPETILHNKDIVKVITNNHSYGPRDNWLDIVKTTQAKRKIKEFRN